MVSVVLRQTILPLVTPDELRGRVNAVEMVFISASNELGAFESGVAAALVGAVPAVVIGGVADDRDRGRLERGSSRRSRASTGWTSCGPADVTCDRSGEAARGQLEPAQLLEVVSLTHASGAGRLRRARLEDPARLVEVARRAPTPAPGRAGGRGRRARRSPRRTRARSGAAAARRGRRGGARAR